MNALRYVVLFDANILIKAFNEDRASGQDESGPTSTLIKRVRHRRRRLTTELAYAEFVRPRDFSKEDIEERSAWLANDVQIDLIVDRSIEFVDAFKLLAHMPGVQADLPDLVLAAWSTTKGVNIAIATENAKHFCWNQSVLVSDFLPEGACADAPRQDA